MFVEALLASILQIGPFWQSGPGNLQALRPFYSIEGETVDVLWPVFTRHRDWWRFCWFTNYMEGQNDSYQFQILPFWFNGRTRSGDEYWGLFPFWGDHPHLLTLEDWHFRFWPFWMDYRLRVGGEWVRKNCVLWPFINWRDDGSWGVWPFCGTAKQRESVHNYALWPLFTWARYNADRYTAGAGHSFMFWPFCATVRREREYQTMIIPPLFSYAETMNYGETEPTGWRLRCPWPLVEIERYPDHDRDLYFPFWERRIDKAEDGHETGRVTRILWKFIELYDDETRVFPFWVSRKDDSYFRFWPFYEEMDVNREGTVKWSGVLALFPIRWVDSVDRNWASFWTFYETLETPVYIDHSLFWGLIQWRTIKD